MGCAWLAHLTHPPGGIPTNLVGGWGALGLRISPTHQVGNTPQWGVAHPPGGQRPITLEYQIYLPAIDTIVTGLTSSGRHMEVCTKAKVRKFHKYKFVDA